MSKLRITNKLLFIGCFYIALSGCLDSESTEPEQQNVDLETPVERVLTISDDLEVGANQTVSLTASLTGTEDDVTVVWQQISGISRELTYMADGSVSFVTPNVAADIIKFEASAIDGFNQIVTNLAGELLVKTATINVTGDSFVLDVVDGVADFWEIADSSHKHFVPGANDDTHTADNQPGGNISFLVNDKIGFYDLYVRYLIPDEYGDKAARVTVNGKELTRYFSATGKWETAHFGVIRMLEGNNQIVIGGGHNYYRVDEISLEPATPPNQPLVVSNTLVNPDATIQSNVVMRFLTDNYGISTVSGQVDIPEIDGEEVTFTQSNMINLAGGGLYSAGIIGFDLLPYSSTYSVKQPSLSDVMLSHYKNGEVLLSALWTWNAPAGETNDLLGFKSNSTNFDLSAALADTSSADYQALMGDIDLIAIELNKFAEQDIPLLWQPLPQADSNVFWWGSAGAEAVKSLWQLMYERLVNYHQLNNLIWVFAFSEQVDLAFYPGNEVVDIVALEADDGNNQQALFTEQYQKLKDNFDGQKLLTLARTGTVPDVGYLHEQNTFWSYYLTQMTDDGVWGPGNLSSSDLDKGFNVDTLEGKDVPGYVNYIEPGVYLDFDGGGSFEQGVEDSYSISSTFDKKVDWISQLSKPAFWDSWSADGQYSLVSSVSPDFIDWSEYPSVVLEQETSTNLRNVNSLKLTVNAMGAGEGVTARIFVRHGLNMTWLDSGSVAIKEGGTELSISLTDVEFLHTWGVMFENFDTDSADIDFFIDSVVFQ